MRRIFDAARTRARPVAPITDSHVSADCGNFSHSVTYRGRTVDGLLTALHDVLAFVAKRKGAPTSAYLSFRRESNRIYFLIHEDSTQIGLESKKRQWVLDTYDEVVSVLRSLA